ncbi:MAG: hypothetical protein D6718_01715 [Acidobacteria bacterium]|nr:MAG: hypothetical protein D6718_01715 [Acidobacteriota bacterium]
MDFQQALRRAWRIVQLDEEAVKEVAEDREALLPGLLIAVIGGLLAGIGGAFWSAGLGLLFVPAGIVWLPVSVFVTAVIYHLLAILFGGQGRLGSLFNALAHGLGLTQWVGIVPVIGSFVASLWGLVVSVVAVRAVHSLSTGRAVAVVAIPIVLLLACCAAVVLVAGATTLAAFFLGQQ